MRRNLLQVLSSTAIVVLLSVFAFAQDSRVLSAAGDIYVISAKAGGVNFIQGKVSIARKIGKSGLLLKGDNIEIGDKISTGADGKAEILLNPGSYVRLSNNSSLEFVSTNLDDLQIKLNGGSAIFEVFADKEFSVAVNTPKTGFNLIQSGIYRIDVPADGTEKIEVWKGRAQIGNDENNIVKGGKAALIVNGQQQVEKFDRDEKDELEIWSKERAKELAKINSRLERRAMTSSLINSFNSSAWNMYESFGVWVYNRAYGTHCFLPFGYGWRSPYGFGFDYNFWNYRLPQYVYYPPQNSNTATNGNVNTQPASGNLPVKERVRFDIPPYERVKVDTRTRMNDDNFDPITTGRSSAPVFVTPAPVPAGEVRMKPGKGN
jgi:hypothetical protein